MTTPEDLQARAGEAAALMKAMSNPHRLLILCMLCAGGLFILELSKFRQS